MAQMICLLVLVCVLSQMPPRRVAIAQALLEEDDAIHDAGALPLQINIEEFDSGLGLRRYLLSGFKRAVFTAKDVCSLAHHARNGGCYGVSDLALDPSQTGGHFYEHLQRTLPLKSADCFYTARIPLWDSTSQTRVLEDFPMHLPHQIFSEIYKSKPALFDPVNIDFSELPPLWLEHPVFAAQGDKAIPISLYSDGVPHSKTDSFYAYYFKFVHDSERFMICSVRRIDVCRCGCRGMCTFGAIGRILSWSLNTLASGHWPETDHAGNPLRSPGGLLADGCCGGLAEYRADLLEFIQAFGFRTWSNIENPCFICGCSKTTMFQFPDRVEDCVWALRDSSAYNLMVMRSTKKVRITNRAVFKRLQANMEFDPGIGGLGLITDFAELGLARGFRLIETGPAIDLHDLSNIVFPTTLAFFDTSNSLGLTFVAPLFCCGGIIDRMFMSRSHACLRSGNHPTSVRHCFADARRDQFCQVNC